MAHTTASSQAPAPQMREIATTGDGRDITRGFISNTLLIAQDEVLRAKGGDLKVYESLLRDDQVQSAFQQRRLAVISREWQVIAGGEGPRDKAAAAFLEEQLQHIRFDRITDKMLFGVFYGYAVGECLWARDGARIVLDGIKVRKARRFRFDADGRLRLITLNKPEGEIMPERKFWTFSTGADNDDEPYGLGLGHWLYWPVFFKRNDIKFWLMFLEKFGMPTAKGAYRPGTPAEEQTRLLEALAAIQSDSAIILPEGMAVELIEAARSGTADYAALHDRMNAAITKVVLSQTMTTDDGSSRAQAEVHMQVRDEVVKADADLICDAFNRGPALWLTEWNFPGARPPQVWRVAEQTEDLSERAARDRILFDMGYRPSAAYIAETYGPGFVPRGTDEEDAGAVVGGAAREAAGEASSDTGS